ncbi:MAG: hypothetical protein ACM31E_00130 [Fibrobacterota bacterium]|nr:hypothetical protein [Chitinispirillaceae bacterium]
MPDTKFMFRDARSIPDFSKGMIMVSTRKAVLELIVGVILCVIGVLMILYIKDFIPRYLGGAIVSAFGAISITSGIINLSKK